MDDFEKVQEGLDLLFEEFTQKVEKTDKDSKEKHGGILIFGNTEEESQRFDRAVEELKEGCRLVLQELSENDKDSKIKIPEKLLIVGDIGMGHAVLLADIHPIEIVVGGSHLLCERSRDRLNDLVIQTALIARDEIPCIREVFLSEDCLQTDEWREKKVPDNYKATLNRHKFLPQSTFLNRKFLQNRG